MDLVCFSIPTTTYMTVISSFAQHYTFIYFSLASILAT